MTEDRKQGDERPSQQDNGNRGLENLNEGFSKQDQAGRISSFDRPAPKPKDK